MTDYDPGTQILDQAWLKRKLEADRAQAKKEAQERAYVQSRDQARAAFEESTGTEPSEFELDELVEEIQRRDVADRLAANKAVARAQIRAAF
jgi:cytidylate kinase